MNQMSGSLNNKKIMEEDPWKTNEPMYKDGRSVPVVDVDDRALDVALTPLATDGLRRKKQEPLLKLMLITILRQEKSITIEAVDTATDVKFESTMKLPSLAIVDPEAGLSFVQRVASKLRIQRDDQGQETLRIR